jgi:type IV pilus assembly protein PilV
MQLIRPSLRKPQFGQNGATLIEVLIAILIFGLGMLGMVGLMASTAKYQSGNQSRLQIGNAIESMGERIRGNISAANGMAAPVNSVPAFVTGTGYNFTTTFATEAAIPLANIWPPATDCSKVVCTSAQLAAYDMVAWRAQLKRSMPSGAGVVTGTVQTGFDVTIMWFDKTSVKGDDAQFLDTEIANQTCPVPAPAPNSAAARFCCPAQVAAPDGVRCYNAKIIP